MNGLVKQLREWMEKGIYRQAQVTFEPRWLEIRLCDKLTQQRPMCHIQVCVSWKEAELYKNDLVEYQIRISMEKLARKVNELEGSQLSASDQSSESEAPT